MLDTDYNLAGVRRRGKFNMQSDSQVVIVTGAASGIGQELCRLFARRGARVGLIDREKSKLDAFADELCQTGIVYSIRRRCPPA